MLSENCLISFTSLGGVGGYPNYEYYDDILEYDPSIGQWSLIDKMLKVRAMHAVSVITTRDIDMYC